MKSACGLALARLAAHTALNRPDIELRFPGCFGTYVPNGREMLADEAIRVNASHVFWLDSDMTFPRDALLRLLAHDVPVVAANYTERKRPFFPVAVKDFATSERLYTDEESRGLVEVAAVGFGCCLMETTVFAPLEKPYFMLGYSHESRSYVGEDTGFCAKLGQVGTSILVDQDLSKEVEHLGVFPFGYTHAKRPVAV